MTSTHPENSNADNPTEHSKHRSKEPDTLPATAATADEDASAPQSTSTAEVATATLQYSADEISMIPLPPPETLNLQIEPSVTVDATTPDPETHPTPTFMSSDMDGIPIPFGDDVIIQSDSSDEMRMDTLRRELKRLKTLNAEYAEQVRTMKDALQHPQMEENLKPLWEVMKNATATEQAIAQTLMDLNGTIDEYSKLAKTHANTLRDLVGEFITSKQEAFKCKHASEKADAEMRHLSLKIDATNTVVETLTKQFEWFKEALNYIADSINGGDTKAKKGLSHVDFSMVPTSARGSLTPPHIVNDADATPAPVDDRVEHAPLQEAAEVADAPKPQGEKPKKSCVLCGKTHYLATCKSYGNAQSRRDRAKELNVCIRCAEAVTLDEDGNHADCPSAENPCQTCKDIMPAPFHFHHGAFCFVKSKMVEAELQKKAVPKRKLPDAERGQQPTHAPKRASPHRGDRGRDTHRNDDRRRRGKKDGRR